MSWLHAMHRPVRLTALLLLTAPIGGCTFDYLNRLDRVTLAGGNAVQANLERETVNPGTRAAYDTHGLGADGGVIPEPDAASADAQPGGS